MMTTPPALAPPRGPPLPHSLPCPVPAGTHSKYNLPLVVSPKNDRYIYFSVSSSFSLSHTTCHRHHRHLRPTACPRPLPLILRGCPWPGLVCPPPRGSPPRSVTRTTPLVPSPGPPSPPMPPPTLPPPLPIHASPHAMTSAPASHSPGSTPISAEARLTR